MGFYNDYTKFGKHNKYKNENIRNEEKTNVLKENEIEFEELPEEEIDKLKDDEIIDVTVDEIVNNTITYGVVTGCKKLNLRKAANKDSEVLQILEEGQVIKVYENESTDDFYKVMSDSREGYCMKKFIKIN